MEPRKELDPEGLLRSLGTVPLREIAPQMRELLELLDALIYDCDLQTGDVYRSTGLYRIVGFHPHEVPANLAWWSDRIHPDDWTDPKTALPTTIGEAPLTRNVEYRVQHRDGTWRTVEDRSTLIPDATGMPVRIIGCTIDVTQRRRTEENLKRSESRYRFLTDVLPQVFWTTDTLGRPNWFNRRWYEYTGVTEEEAMQNGGIDLIHPEDVDPLMRRWAECSASLEPFEAEYRIKRHDGVYRWHFCRVIPETSPDGELLEWVGSATDIHETHVAREALALSEHRFRVALGNDQITAFHQDRDLKYVWIHNPKGFPVEQVLGKTDHELIGGRAADELTDLKRTVMETGQPIRRQVHIDLPNAPMWFDILVEPYRDQKGAIDGITAASIDITERKLAEEAIRSREQFLRSVMDTLYTFVGVLHPDGRMIAANQAALALRGMKLEDVADRLFWETPWVEGLPNSAEALKDSVARAAAGEVVRFDLEVRGPDNVVFLVDYTIGPMRDEHGRITHLIPSGIDVTFRRHTEDALRASEERLRLATDAAEIGLWFVDLRTGELSWNSHFRRILGQPPDGPNISMEESFALVHPEDRERVSEAVVRCLEAGEELNIEYRIVRPDREERWLAVRGRSSGDASGRTRMLGTAIDVTERKHAEGRLREMNQGLEEMVAERTIELEAANRELEAFCYSVSHDLRAPLRSIDGFSFALLEDYGERIGSEGHDYLMRVRTASKRMDELISSLLTLSRITRAELKRERVDLSELAESVFRELRATEPDREVDTVVQPGLIAHADPRLARIALDNLLRNAWKFTGPVEKPRIEFGADGTSEHGPAFFVQDNGVGFDPEYSKKLFQPFERLHSPSEFPGSGIGLATVQRIVRKHGGNVWATGAVGQGARFLFTLK